MGAAAPIWSTWSPSRTHPSYQRFPDWSWEEVEIASSWFSLAAFSHELIIHTFSTRPPFFHFCITHPLLFLITSFKEVRLRCVDSDSAVVNVPGPRLEDILTRKCWLQGPLLFGEERKKESGLIKAAPRGRKVRLQDFLSDFYKTSQCNYSTLSQQSLQTHRLTRPHV